MLRVMNWGRKLLMMIRIKEQIRSQVLLKRRMLRLYQFILNMERAVIGRKLRVEVCSQCQLRCPSCLTSQGKTKNGAIGQGKMSAQSFEKLISMAGRIRRVELSNWGEIFLNHDLKEIMRIASKRGVSLEAYNGVNLNNATEEMLESLVKYRFRRLSISIDGASNETYRIYRRGGDLDRVLKNIDTINRYKKEYGSLLPVLTWQFISFDHSAHELERARSMAKERDMRFRVVKNMDCNLAAVEQPGPPESEPEIPVQTKRVRNMRELAQSFEFCSQMWDAPQINWDGKLLGCCLNNHGDYGNVFDGGLARALTGESYTYAKKMLLGLAPPRRDIPCYSCSLFREMLR